MAQEARKESSVSSMYGRHWQPRDLSGDLANFRSNGLSNGFDGYTSVKETTRGEITNQDALINYYYSTLGVVGEAFFDRVYFVGPGNPKFVEHKGLKLTYSDLQAVYNAWQFIRFTGQLGHIVEVGPGYGALAACLKKLNPSLQITLVDLPSHHEILRYYLSETVGLNGIEITDTLPEDADALIAIRCLMEMSRSEIAKYFNWAQTRRSLQFFYLVAGYVKYNAVLRHYPFDAKWDVLLSQTEIHSANIHELLLSRLLVDSPRLSMLLASLPPYLSRDRASTPDKMNMHIFSREPK